MSVPYMSLSQLQVATALRPFSNNPEGFLFLYTLNSKLKFSRNQLKIYPKIVPMCSEETLLLFCSTALCMIYSSTVKLQETIEAALLFQPHIVMTVFQGFLFLSVKTVTGSYRPPPRCYNQTLVIHMVLGFWDMLLAARYNRQGLNAPVHFHYVAALFWDWKGGEARLRDLVQFVDHFLCKLPNEEEVCRSNGLAATFVGHPSLEDVWELNAKETSPHEWKMEDRRKLRRFLKETCNACRLQYITRMPSIFTDAMALIQVSFPGLVTVIHIAPNQHVKNYVTGITNKWPVPAILIPGGSLHEKYDAFSASSVALCASGTVALEMQFARLPCVVAYSHVLTELIIHYEAKVPIVSLPNVLMDSPIMPEALFQACTLTNLASLLDLILANGLREKQIVAAEKVIRLLCAPARNLDPLAEQDQGGRFPNNTPRMIAATAILHHAKT